MCENEFTCMFSMLEKARTEKIATSGFLQHEINVGLPLSHIYTIVNNFGAYPLDCQLLKYDADNITLI